jgi:hypothetical protein
LSCPVLIFCAPKLIVGGSDGAESPLHNLRSRTHFRRFRGSWVPFSCFAFPNSFSAAPRALGPILMFYTPGVVFDGTKGVGSSFHILRSHNRFLRYRGVGTRIDVLLSRTCFGWLRWRRDRFSCLALPDLFWAVPRASSPVFLFGAPGHVLSGTAGVRSNFDVLRCRTHFWHYRGRQVSFSCFAFPDSFWRYQGSWSPFNVFSPSTHFWRYRGRPVPFSCLSLSKPFSAVPRDSGPVLMFCAP